MHAVQKGISFFAEYIPSEKNPADLPSRQPEVSRGSIHDYYSQYESFDLDAFYNFHLKNHPKVSHDHQTVIYNMIQNPKLRAWAVSHFQNLLVDHIDEYIGRPVKTLYLKAAIEIGRAHV